MRRAKDIQRYNAMAIDGEVVLRKSKYGKLVMYEDTAELRSLAAFAEDIADRLSTTFGLYDSDAVDELIHQAKRGDFFGL